MADYYRQKKIYDALLESDTSENPLNERQKKIVDAIGSSLEEEYKRLNEYAGEALGRIPTAALPAAAVAPLYFKARAKFPSVVRPAEQAAFGFMDTAALGAFSTAAKLADPDAGLEMDPRNFAEHLAKGAGQLGGFIAGAPLRIGKAATTEILKRAVPEGGKEIIGRTGKTILRTTPGITGKAIKFAEAFAGKLIGKKATPELSRRAVKEALTLGVASAVSANESLTDFIRTPSYDTASKIASEKAFSAAFGTFTGGQFGVVMGKFDKFATRAAVNLAITNAMRIGLSGGEVNTADVVFGSLLDIFGSISGKKPTKRELVTISQAAKDMEPAITEAVQKIHAELPETAPKPPRQMKLPLQQELFGRVPPAEPTAEPAYQKRGEVLPREQAPAPVRPEPPGTQAELPLQTELFGDQPVSERPDIRVWWERARNLERKKDLTPPEIDDAVMQRTLELENQRLPLEGDPILERLDVLSRLTYRKQATEAPGRQMEIPLQEDVFAQGARAEDPALAKVRELEQKPELTPPEVDAAALERTAELEQTGLPLEGDPVLERLDNLSRRLYGRPVRPTQPEFVRRGDVKPPMTEPLPAPPGQQRLALETEPVQTELPLETLPSFARRGERTTEFVRRGEVPRPEQVVSEPEQVGPPISTRPTPKTPGKASDLAASFQTGDRIQVDPFGELIVTKAGKNQLKAKREGSDTEITVSKTAAQAARPAKAAPEQQPPVTTTQEAAVPGGQNKIFTEQAYQDALSHLKGLGARAYDIGGAVGEGPGLLKDWVVIGGYHFERGVRDYAAWSNNMLKQFGENIRPQLQDIWNTVNRVHAIGELKAAQQLFDAIEMGRVARTSKGIEEVSTSKKELLGTKVVDEKGKPTRVFHGTNAIFEEFDPKFADPGAFYGKGFYFTDSGEVASQYPLTKGAPYGVTQTAENVKIAYLNIKKPFDMDKYYTAADFPSEFRPLFEAVGTANKKMSGNVIYTLVNSEALPAIKYKDSGDIFIGRPGIPQKEIARDPFLNAFRSILSSSPSKVNKEYTDGWYFGKQFTETKISSPGDFQSFLKKSGFDGITHIGGKIMGDRKHRVWIAFDADQIVYPDEFAKPKIKSQIFEKELRETTFGAQNTIFTQSAYEAALAELRKGPGKVYDLGGALGDAPGLIKNWVVVGGYYIEAGARNFKPWSERMIKELGEGIRPYLQAIWEAANKGLASKTLDFSAIDPQPFFYSQLRETIARKLPNTGTGESMLQILEGMQKGGEFARAEMELSGVGDFLLGAAQRKSKVSKQDILEIIDTNSLRLEEHVISSRGAIELRQRLEQAYRTRTGRSPFRRGSDTPTDDFTASAEGAEWIDTWSMKDAVKFSQNTAIPPAKNYSEITVNDPKLAYESPHFGDKGTIAHMRTDERVYGATAPDDPNTRTALHVHEIQSELHQAGRAFGYYDPKIPEDKGLVRRLKFERVDLENQARHLLLKIIKREENKGHNYITAHEIAIDDPAMRELYKRLEDIDDQLTEYRKQVPEAPLKTEWPEHVMKRLLRSAVEKGKDSLTWTTGEQQFSLYGSERILWKKSGDGWRVLANDQVSSGEIGNRAGRDIANDVLTPKPGFIGSSRITEVKSADELFEVVKSSLLANRSRSVKQARSVSDKIWERMQKEDAGMALPRKEGMEKFYDEMLPSFINKYGKKWGMKADRVDVATETQEITVWEGEPLTRGKVADAIRELAETGSPEDIFIARTLAIRMPQVGPEKAVTSVGNAAGAERLAEILRGRFVEKEVPVETASVNRVEITPAFRSVARAGQPLLGTQTTVVPETAYKSALDIAKSFPEELTGAETFKTAVGETLKGLYELGGGARLGARAGGFTRQDYEAAAPHFRKAWETVGAYHAERLARSDNLRYTPWTQAMLRDLGEGIKPRLEHIWQAVQDDFAANIKVGRYPAGTQDILRQMTADLTTPMESEKVRRGVLTRERRQNLARLEGAYIERVKKGTELKHTERRATPEQLEALNSELARHAVEYQRNPDLLRRDLNDPVKSKEIHNLILTQQRETADAGRKLELMKGAVDPGVAEGFAMMYKYADNPKLKEAAQKMKESFEKKVPPKPGFMHHWTELQRNLLLAFSSAAKSVVSTALALAYRFPVKATAALIERLAIPDPAKRGVHWQAAIAEATEGYLRLKNYKQGMVDFWKVIREDDIALSENPMLQMETQGVRAFKHFGRTIRFQQNLQGGIDAFGRNVLTPGIIAGKIVTLARREGRKVSKDPVSDYAQRIEELHQSVEDVLALRRDAHNAARDAGFTLGSREYDQAYNAFVKQGLPKIPSANEAIDIIEKSRQEALEELGMGKLTGVAGAIQAFRQQHLWTKLIVPFFPSFANFMRKAVAHTPFAAIMPSFYKAAYRAMHTKGELPESNWGRFQEFMFGKTIKEMKAEDPTTAEFSDRVARMLFGTMVLSTGFDLITNMLEGRISGRGPDDPRIRDMMFQADGWKPYSVKIGDTWMSYLGYEPLSTWLALMADWQYSDPNLSTIDKIAKSWKTLMTTSLENPFMLGVKGMMEAAEQDRKASTLAANFVASFTMPTVARQFRYVLDPLYRTTKEKEIMTGAWEKYQARVPGVSEKFLPRIDVFGNPVEKEYALYSMIGVNISDARYSKTASELLRLNINIGEPGDVIRGTRLTPDDHYKLKIITGRALKEGLDRLTSSADYISLSDDQKKEYIESTIRAIRNQARQELQRQMLFYPQLQTAPRY